jgi:hypothetical protein
MSELKVDWLRREPTRIMFQAVPDELPTIQRAWAGLEELVGMSGRKFYGVFDVPADQYLVCAEIKPDDPADSFGLRTGELAGGEYLRVRLRGEPPEVYGQIKAGFDVLHASAARDPRRHDVEFYKRRNEIELWMPC